ncbi:MAG: hypothetical protein JJ974_02105 [Phycisphaerales bacterium]|nr:hypothetical protein [Phycisphaerales bacterium]
MGVTDIMSNLSLEIYPIIALILFLVAFSIIIWGVLRAPRAVITHQSMLPLEDDTDFVISDTPDSSGKKEQRNG